MAKEINSNLRVTINPSGNNSTGGGVQSIEDLAGGVSGFQQSIGFAAAEAITLGADVTAPKLVYIQNLDPTHFVVIDNVIGLTGWPQKLLPGTAIVLRPEATALFAKADTAAVNIWVVAG
jgi:hypothetical protein